MTNYKNNLPPYAEEQTIQQKIRIPSNFIDLGQPKKYWGSTAGLDKTLCERYNFKHNDKTVVLDLSQRLIEKFGLKEKEIHSFGAYINKDLLKKTPEEGGITVDKEKDIICQTEGIILVQEKGGQADFTSGEITDLKQKLKKSEELSQETQKLLERLAKDNEEKHIAIIFFEAQIKNLTQRITELRRDLEQEILDKKREESKNRELERIIKKLKEDEQVLIGLQNRISDLQRELGDERLAWEEIKKDLQNKIQEKNEHLAITQWKYGNEILEDFRQINFLKREIDRLNDIIGLLEKLTEDELNEKQGIINGLTIQKGDLQTQLDDKKQKLNKWTDQFPNNQTPETVQGKINTLNASITQRDTQIYNLNAQIATLNTQKLTSEEQNAIAWTQLCLTAMNNALANSNTSYLDNYQSYFNPIGVFHSSITGGLAKYGRMNQVVTNLINTWNQTRTQINDKNNCQSQISSLQSKLNTANSELVKEKGWWDKWINDEKDFLCSTTVNDKFYLFIKWPQYRFSIFDFFIPGISNFDNTTDILSFKEFKGLGLFFDREQHELNKDLLENSSRSFKEMIKRKVYQYYRDE